MKLTLQRFSLGDNCTLGLLFADCDFLCFTLEDEYRTEKVRGQTRIPAGEYDITLRTVGGFHSRYAGRFGDMHKGMLWLRDVPDFEYILIHCGNNHEHTEGCILVGDGQTTNVGRDGFLSHSEAAYRRIYPPIAAALLAGEEVWIEVRDEGQMDI